LLRISEHWEASDLGRQRQGNEDNLFVRAPLFVVADGMGGAQAGEVASKMAVDSFQSDMPGGDPAEALVQIIEGANRAIHDRSRTDAKTTGMGTTVTAAYVGESDVTIAHVGDSRAYVLRGSDLIRLTRDHSLVGELVLRGKLTEEQAEMHPQRSVITRALGSEPDVDVDVHVYQARSGDVFMLNSDGLTSMVPDDRVKGIVAGASTLEQAGRELINAANDAGGKDNITVILFRLEDVDGAEAPGDSGETTQYETWEGDSVPAPRHGVTRPEATASDEMEAEYRRTGTTALSAVKPRAEPIEEPPRRTVPPGDQTRKRRRRRIPGPLIAVVIVLLIVVAGFWTASRAVYFVGVDDTTGVVTIYRGVPYELPFGLNLYSRDYTSGVRIEQVPAARRQTFTEHKLRSRDDAKNLVIELERGRLE
jgi:serine/threonine protein phosphatase PrpC